MIKQARWYLSAAVIAAGGAVAIGQAEAAGFGLKEQSAEAQGTSYAGAGARADDPSTLFYNPAGITHLHGYQISLSAAGIFPDGTLASGSATNTARLPAGGTTGMNSGVSAFLPSFYATAEINPRLFAGLAVTSPYGLATKYPTSSITRYYGLTTSLRVINIGPTLAFKVTPQISVGGGLNIETADAHLSNSVDFGTIGYAYRIPGLYPGSADGLGTLKGTDTALGWNLAALYEPGDDWRIGATYRSAVFHNLTGTLGYQSVPTYLQAKFQNAAASAKVPEPSTFSLSAAKDIGPWTALADVTYTGWSVFQNLTVISGGAVTTATAEKFKDTVSVAVGADYRLNDQLTLRGGVAWDPTPVQNSYRTPRIADNDRFWLSIGATWRPTPNWAISGAYSHLFANNDSVNLTDLGPGTVNYLKGSLSGIYNVSVDIVSAQVTYRF